MRHRIRITALLVALSAVSLYADQQRWWSHVEALANDAMAGRNTGSPEHQRAAAYVAAAFQRAGLDPAGTDGYLQPVTFKTRQIVEAQSRLSLIRNGNTEPLMLGEDTNFSMRIDPAPSVSAPLVFVGYGLNIPEQHINEFEELNLRGAVVVYINATPRTLAGPLQAHYGSVGERWRMYRAAGAIGIMSINNPRTTDTPWERSTVARLQPSMSLADPALDDTARQQFSATMNPAHADKLFQGTGHTFGELLALVEVGTPLPHFALTSRITATVKVDGGDVVSHNVAGILRGSDAQRRGEYLVVSAHLDHLGVGEPINGDRIYNGAMDNASGIATILELATEFRERNLKPARSIVFVAVTGEEKGELGSKYFASHPTVPGDRIVANVNIDMFLPLFPLNTLMLGLHDSDLGGDIRAVAAQLGLIVQPDPEPQRNRFARSDQYSFVKNGIPALATKVGYEPDTPEAEVARKWTAERYHAPSDDLQQPIDLTAADKYVDVLRELALRVANRGDRPKWNDASFFKRFAKAPGSQQ